MIPREFIEELNRDADIADVVGRHVRLERKGSSLVGLCPFHNEKTPSFNVVSSKGFYHCFGCGVSGSALTFLMRQVHGGDFLAAVEDLADMLGRKIPRSGGRSDGDRSVWKILAEAASFFAQRLRTTPRARNFIKSRGLNGDTAQRYGLGYAPPGGSLDAFASHARELIVAAGLAKKDPSGSVYAYFRDRIMFPIAPAGGKVAGFGGRVIDDGEPKYLNSPKSACFDKSALVFGLNEARDGIREHGFAIVVEGYMDVVMLAQHGVGCAVAVMGTAATEAQMRRVLTSSGSVVCCFDGDASGRRAAFRALGNMMPALSDGDSVRFAFLPQGEDPDSFVRAHGREKFLRLLGRSHSLERMLTEKPFEAADKSRTSEARKSESLRSACALVEKMDSKRSPFLQGVLYERLSKESGQREEDLRRAAQAALRRPPPAPASKRKMRLHNVYQLIACLFADASQAAQCADAPLFCESDSDRQLCVQIREHLVNAARTGEEASVGQFLRDRQLHGLLAQLEATVATWQKTSEQPGQRLTKCLAAMQTKLNRRRRRTSEVERVKKEIAKGVKG